MRKVNAITQNPEIMQGVYSVHDGRFITNKYGYMANIRDPEILAEYERFRASRKACILSDEERFFFDIQMIKKYRPHTHNNGHAQIRDYIPECFICIFSYLTVICQ